MSSRGAFIVVDIFVYCNITDFTIDILRFEEGDIWTKVRSYIEVRSLL